ncbi:ferredoxin reductase family protein [Musicola paradisiaca]|uniref:Ferric reductase domain protein protein transmembrane component domain protein n=1 Tax=Musicola paradisiaca (strain Ech703) TaxID=579405 RepID=C6C5P8_MUSP7|nr:ferric reductase-like transmembrane domain-containing protein [Musicola paradisiaca]ACS83861.1 Ferric reductase domain protein protein transmembrane component domain protein [Musicola paradisiaca Ech703]
MKLITVSFLVCLTIWALSLPEVTTLAAFFYWRDMLLQLTGFIAVLCIAGLLLMALHPSFLEKRLGGMDKMYLQHKYLGIGAGVATLLHWLFAKLPKIAAALEWVTSGRHQPHPFDPWRKVMDEFGEIAFYGMTIFIAVSLIKWISYKHFRIIHKIGAIIALLGMIHSFYMINNDMRWTAFGIAIMVLCVISAAIALYSLAGQIGKRNNFPGKITATNKLNDSTLELTINIPASFSRHYQPGKFIFLTTDPKEGKHPFTISRYDANHQTLTITIKALGDYTASLVDAHDLIGKNVVVEGPYGDFILPAHPDKPTYWVAGGIGITPFLSWLYHLHDSRAKQANTTLFYCVNSETDLIHRETLEHLAGETGVNLNIIVRDRDGLLDPQRIPTDDCAGVWFCGPAGMRRYLQRRLGRSALHFEQFDFR